MRRSSDKAIKKRVFGKEHVSVKSDIQKSRRTGTAKKDWSVLFISLSDIRSARFSFIATGKVLTMLSMCTKIIS